MKLEHSYNVDGDINHYYLFRFGDPYKNAHKYSHSGLESVTKPVPDPLAMATTPVPSRALARPLPHLWLPLAPWLLPGLRTQHGGAAGPGALPLGSQVSV